MPREPFHNDKVEIKEALKLRIAELCRALLPNGHLEGRLFVANHPFKDDPKQLPALKVAIRGDKGAWRCWRSGDKGDVIQLIELCLATDFRGAMTWARDFLGLQQMSREDRAAMRERAERQAAVEAQRQVKDRADKIIRAQELFHVKHAFAAEGAAAHPIEAHIRAYFTARGCPLEAVPQLNRESFRFSEATEWWKGAKWSTERGHRFKAAPGPQFPALHSAMRARTGSVTCCHITYLDPVRPAKAPVEPPKLMFGEALGSVIEVSCGAGGMAFWNETVPRPVVVCEGIETAVSIAGALPDVRVWAGGSLAGMAGVPVDLPCVSDITVARDNNTGNSQAQAQLARCLEALSAHNKPLVVMNSHVGDDFNDLIGD